MSRVSTRRSTPASGDLLDELMDIIATAKSMPLSSSVMVSRDEVLDLLEAARDQFPEELRERGGC